MTSDGQKGAGGRGPGKRRWLWPVLIVSLALNLLFIGLFAGQWWVHGPRGSRAPYHVITGAVEGFVKELPAGKQEHARNLLEQHRKTIDSIRRQFRDARRAAKDATVAEPYDDARLAAALAKLRELRTGQYESTHIMVRELLKNLSLDERKKLLEHVRAAFRRGRVRRDRSPGDAPAPRQ